MNELSNIQQTNEVISEIEQAFFDIPFENSDFQNEVFVLAAQVTPERAYRALGLRMHAKLRALRENFFSERKREIALGELREKLADPSLSKWDKMRIEVEIEEILSSVSYTDKLKNDAIKELECLYKHFKAMPKFTREQFESAEKNHFQQKLTRAINGVTNYTESLINMQEDMPALVSYEKQIAELGLNNSTADLEALRLSMPNQVK